MSLEFGSGYKIQGRGEAPREVHCLPPAHWVPRVPSLLSFGLLEALRMGQEGEKNGSLLCDWMREESGGHLGA